MRVICLLLATVLSQASCQIVDYDAFSYVCRDILAGVRIYPLEQPYFFYQVYHAFILGLSGPLFPNPAEPQKVLNYFDKSWSSNLLIRENLKISDNFSTLEKLILVNAEMILLDGIGRNMCTMEFRRSRTVKPNPSNVASFFNVGLRFRPSRKHYIQCLREVETNLLPLLSSLRKYYQLPVFDTSSLTMSDGPFFPFGRPFIGQVLDYYLNSPLNGQPSVNSSFYVLFWAVVDLYGNPLVPLSSFSSFSDPEFMEHLSRDGLTLNPFILYGKYLAEILLCTPNFRLFYLLFYRYLASNLPDGGPIADIRALLGAFMCDILCYVESEGFRFDINILGLSDKYPLLLSQDRHLYFCKETIVSIYLEHLSFLAAVFFSTLPNSYDSWRMIFNKMMNISIALAVFVTFLVFLKRAFISSTTFDILVQYFLNFIIHPVTVIYSKAIDVFGTTCSYFFHWFTSFSGESKGSLPMDTLGPEVVFTDDSLISYYESKRFSSSPVEIADLKYNYFLRQVGKFSMDSTEDLVDFIAFYYLTTPSNLVLQWNRPHTVAESHAIRLMQPFKKNFSVLDLFFKRHPMILINIAKAAYVSIYGSLSSASDDELPIGVLFECLWKFFEELHVAYSSAKPDNLSGKHFMYSNSSDVATFSWDVTYVLTDCVMDTLLNDLISKIPGKQAFCQLMFDRHLMEKGTFAFKVDLMSTLLDTLIQVIFPAMRNGTSSSGGLTGALRTIFCLGNGPVSVVHLAAFKRLAVAEISKFPELFFRLFIKYRAPEDWDDDKVLLLFQKSHSSFAMIKTLVEEQPFLFEIVEPLSISGMRYSFDEYLILEFVEWYRHSSPTEDIELQVFLAFDFYFHLVEAVLEHRLSNAIVEAGKQLEFALCYQKCRESLSIRKRHVKKCIESRSQCVLEDSLDQFFVDYKLLFSLLDQKK